MGKTDIRIKLNETIDIIINRYKEETYIHFFQKNKSKNFTFHKNSIEKLFGFEKKIFKGIKEVEKRSKKSKPIKSKNGRSKRNSKLTKSKGDNYSDTEEESEMEFTEDEDESE